MSTTPVTKKTKRPPTTQQLRIAELEKQKENLQKAKKEVPEALSTELKTLKASEKKLTLARLASGRVNKLVDLMRQIGNLGAYKPSQKQTEVTFKVIKDSVQQALDKWMANKTEETDSFSLPTE